MWDQTDWDDAGILQQRQDVRDAARNLVREYCVHKGLNANWTRYTDEVLSGMPETNSEAVAVWMWTSTRTTPDLHTEFCSILNEALRVDVGDVGNAPAAGNPEHSSIGALPISPMLQPATLIVCMLQRFLNATRRIENGTALPHEAWPQGDGVDSTARDTTFRGGWH